MFVPKIIQTGKCLLKLQLKMSGMFFETQCSVVALMSNSGKRWEQVVHLESHVLYPARSRRTCTHRAARAIPAQVRERLFQQHGDGRRLHEWRHNMICHGPLFFVFRATSSFHVIWLNRDDERLVLIACRRNGWSFSPVAYNCPTLR